MGTDIVTVRKNVIFVGGPSLGHIFDIIDLGNVKIVDEELLLRVEMKNTQTASVGIATKINGQEFP